MPNPLELPADTLGADLYWWRETGNLHTLVSIYWKEYARLEGVTLRFMLFDDGRRVASWQVEPVEDQVFLIDSKHPPDAVAAAEPVAEGVLAVFVSAPDGGVGAAARLDGPDGDAYKRLYGLIDWYADDESDGSICGLHSDQAVVRAPYRNHFTEIVVEETSEQKSYLVVLNGPDEQPAGAVSLELRNHLGATRTARHLRPMRPFTATRLRVSELFPDAVGFSGGRHLTVSGHFDSTGLFIRPYVMTSGAFMSGLSGYHGGDVYSDLAPIGAFAERFLDRGRINPMFAVHRDDLTTTVNIFNSHGPPDFDEDFSVDAYLYDEVGTLVAERPRWLAATRHGLARGDIAELLPDPTRPFVGHVTLAFTREDRPVYPRVLQALLEYRTVRGTARVMGWSDEWNSPQRAAVRGRVPYGAFSRVWCRPPLETQLCITNCGNERRYADEAPFTATLLNEQGDRVRAEGVVPPHGTCFQTIDAIFPDAARFLAPKGVGIVVVESVYDLADIQITRHTGTGAVAAEHFMALTSELEGERLRPSGS
ncbi:MAG: hypothetical protein CL477_19815 [Acidobacteria bacterium]|nr:hypothetical protein [Acidobacteriota bacterium]